MIDKHDRSDSPRGLLIDPETGNEVKNTFISVPYFSGLSESYKNVFKYTHTGLHQRP